MKSRDIFRVAGPAAVLIAVALLCSCTTTNLASNRTGWSDYATVAIKDYTVVGIVRVVSEEVTRRGFLGIAKSHKGSQVTYDLLVSEAKKIGADDIINVRIDRTDKSLHGIFDWLVGYTEKYAYTANALAIKYTQAVAGSFTDGAGGPSGMGGGPGLTEVATLQGPAEADATPATPQHQSRDGQNRRQKTMATAQ
jgi:uncharacterized protein YbjQ (UPF0145 family)